MFFRYHSQGDWTQVRARIHTGNQPTQVGTTHAGILFYIKKIRNKRNYIK